MLLMGILALWIAAYGYSLFMLLTGDVSGGAFTSGLNRFSIFLGWQGVAGIFAFASFGVGRSFNKGSGIRRVSVVPAVAALALVIIVVAMAILVDSGG